MKEKFLEILTALNTENKIKAVQHIMARYKEQTATDNNFYRNQNKTKAVMNKVMEEVNITIPEIKTLVQLEAGTPYSIFYYILKEDFSDIMIFNNGIHLSDSLTEEKIDIPDELHDIYSIFVNHFIENIIFINSTRFDTANPILDAEVDKLRFNLVHRTLTKSKDPIIVIRKQTVNKSKHLTEEYINSLGASQKQIDIIHKYAQKGNFIIFGEVGSGKTTLLNYMANYKLENKRNLCTIEDTDELNVDVPISLLTTNEKKINDLFVAALRQNPSSIIIGETRTDEIIDILQSALTISVGTTIHANSFERAINRIVFMSLPRNLKSEDVLNLTNAAIDCFIFMEKRKVKEIWIHKEGHENDIYKAYEKVE